MVLFRIGAIGSIGESASRLNNKLNRLNQLYGRIPELITLRDPKRLVSIGDTSDIANLFKCTSSDPSMQSIDPNEPIKSLGLSNRVYGMLMRAEITTLGDLIKHMEDIERFKRINGMGIVAINEIEDKLNKLKA